MSKCLNSGQIQHSCCYEIWIIYVKSNVKDVHYYGSYHFGLGLNFCGLGLDGLGLGLNGLDFCGLSLTCLGLDFIGLDFIGLDFVSLDWHNECEHFDELWASLRFKGHHTRQKIMDDDAFDQ